MADQVDAERKAGFGRRRVGGRRRGRTARWGHSAARSTPGTVGPQPRGPRREGVHLAAAGSRGL